MPTFVLLTELLYVAILLVTVKQLHDILDWVDNNCVRISSNVFLKANLIIKKSR